MASSGFIFEVQDWLASKPVQRMSFAERGVFFEMLCQQWEKRTLPDEAAAVADLIAMTDAQRAEVIAAWDVVRRKFVTDERTPGRIYNVRLERTRRQKARSFRKRSESGRNAGKVSAANRKAAKEIPVNESLPVVDDRQRKPTVLLCSEVLCSEVSSGVDTDPPPVDPRVDAAKLSTLSDQETEDRAASLLKRFPILYAKHRHGARTLIKPSLDFQRALDVCRTWPDDTRLDKLMEILFTTDETWVASTDRGFGVFVAKAGWCDDRLRAWEVEHGVSV